MTKNRACFTLRNKNSASCIYEYGTGNEKLLICHTDVKARSIKLGPT
jgi:hypothetical protein